ncbi:Thoeris anti-defense Tad2 family protein, partial [Xenorhabdus szentirmaii]
MSEVSKLDNKQCPFDPDLYHYKKQIDIEVDNVAPDGSSPWALMQVYIGKVLSRSGWGANEYIQLSAKNDSSGPIHIEKHDQQSFPFPWEPTPEDLMACDWKLMKTEDCMLSFDLTSGSGTYNNPSLPNEPVAWGYIRNLDWGHHFGELNNEQNNVIDIEKIWCFLLYDGIIFFDVSTKPNKESRQKVIDLFQNKDFWVIIDNKKYNLGKSTPTQYPNTSNTS